MRYKLGRMLNASEGLAQLDQQDRYRHLYCLGKTRSGKSTMLLNMIARELDHACIVLDPAGSFAKSVADLAPPDRLIYIDKNNPLVINPMDRKGIDWAEAAKEFTEVMNACIVASTSSPETTVLMGEILLHAFRVLKGKEKNIEYLSEFLNNEFVRKKHHPDKYWEFFDHKQGGFYLNKEKVESAKRIGARLSYFHVDPNIHQFTIGSNGRNEFDVADFVANKKIVIVNLRGFDDGSKIYLGNLVTHAVKSYYQHQAVEGGLPLYLYIDEFHSFMTPFFDDMLAQAAKFNISVNLAHQNHAQISNATLSAIMGNCFTKIVFQCGFEEAERMANEYSLKSSDFMKLGKHEAYIQIGNKSYKVATYAPPKITEKGEIYFLDETDGWIDP